MDVKKLGWMLCLALVACDDGAESEALDSAADASLEDAEPDAARPRDAAEPEPDSSQPPPPDAEVCPFASEPDDIPAAPIDTPRWAFEPWISKDISDRDDTFAFVRGFRERDIPVGVVVIDSPWETNYNTFVPNEDWYPDFGGMVAELGADQIRVVMWTTQMVNQTSFDFEMGSNNIYPGAADNFAEGQLCGFFTDEGTVWPWWKGRGAAVDFFDPLAVTWWHRQQDLVLEMGIAGWKLDFGEEYIEAEVLQTEVGEVSRQAYSEAYYKDFYDYGVSRLGAEDFTTMVRPYDRSYGFPGRFFARPEHAPVAWVGDNRRDWVGLVDALDHIFRSAAAGYVVVGSDIGGYLDVDDEDFQVQVPPDQDTFVRWVAMGALMPFMQLHGRANLTPWTVHERAEETVAIYRYWSWVHHQLVPFFYSLAQEAYAGAEPIIRPIGALADWPGDWRFMLGEALLVAPLFEAGGRRDVILPEGTWYDWWTGAAHAGAQTLEDYDATDQQRIPLFVRAGAILPLKADSEVTGWGSEAAADALTVLVWPGPPSTFRVHEEDGEVTTISQAEGAVTLSRVPRTTIVRVRLDEAPEGIEAFERVAMDEADSGRWYEAEAQMLWIKVALGEAPVELRW